MHICGVQEAGYESKHRQDQGRALNYRSHQTQNTQALCTEASTERRLLLSPGDPSQWVQLVEQAEYLGLIISYSHFEKQSVKHRIAKANHRRWALASILHTKQMSIAYKLQLCRSCVLSTMMYALHCLRLSPGHVHLLQKTIMKHTRAIVSGQAFLTGTTREEIMTKYNIRSACSVLEQAHGRELKLEQFEDWMVDPTWNQVISDGLQIAAQHTEPESDAEQEVWACPVCEEQFGNPAALKIHARRVRKLVDHSQKIFDRTKHALHGLPQCAGFYRKFSRWQTLEVHVDNNSCPARVQDVHTIGKAMEQTIPHVGNASETKDDIQAFVQTDTLVVDDSSTAVKAVQEAGPLVHQALVQTAVAQGLNHFIHQPDLTQHLLQHCALCGQWIASHRVMKTHYKYTHTELFHKFQDKAQKLISQKAKPSVNCHFCRRRTKDWKAHIHSMAVCVYVCSTSGCTSRTRRISSGTIIRRWRTSAGT